MRIMCFAVSVFIWGHIVGGALNAGKLGALAAIVYVGALGVVALLGWWLERIVMQSKLPAASGDDVESVKRGY